IQAFRQAKNMTEVFEELNEKHCEFPRRFELVRSLTCVNLVTVLRNLTLVDYVVYCGSPSLERNGVISLGLLYALVDYISRLVQPVNNIVNQLPLIEQARVAGGRVFELLDLEGERVNVTPIDRYKGIVEFDPVTFSYDGETDVLKDVSFKVNY